MLIAMAKEHHVIIVRGLGDHRLMRSQWNFITKLWGLFGVKVHVFTPGWADGKSFAPKLKRLTDQVDYLTGQGFLVSLVGISAGASAAINAYVSNRDKIHKVVFICGKIHSPDKVNARYFIENPAFKDSLDLSTANSQKLGAIDQQKILYMHALSDMTVPPGLNKLAGVQTKAVIAFGHILGIAVAVTFYSRTICRFLKR